MVDNTSSRKSIPDYSPREKKLLLEAGDYGLKDTTWQTNETPPRKVEILGRAAMDPDVQVIRIEGEPKAKWLHACGSTYDGNIVGTDIWIRETA